MLTFDFICISVLRATPDAKVFFHFTSRGFSLSVAQLWLWWAHPGVMVWASLEDIRWTAGSAFFSPLDSPAVRSWCQGRTEKGSFRVFFFCFVFRCCFFFFLFILCAERVRLWCFYVYAFCCADRTESISLCVNYLFIYCPPQPPHPTPHHPPREHLTLPYFLPCCEELQKAGNGFNTTRAGVWTLLIDELRFIATRVAA